jgi:hypothetical protein
MKRLSQDDCCEIKIISWKVSLIFCIFLIGFNKSIILYGSCDEFFFKQKVYKKIKNH